MTPELLKGGFSLLRGASITEVLIEGAAAAAGSEVLIGVAVVGGGVYLADRLSRGRISDSFGRLVGCKE